MKKICICLLLLISTYHGITQDLEYGFQLENGRKKVSIPFENYNNLVIVPVNLNGKMPLRFLVDTGVKHAILLEKTFSDLLNLKYEREFDLIGTGGEFSAKAFVTNNVRLMLPGMTAKGIQLLVMEENFLDINKLSDLEVHGIIGADLFEHFVVKIDYDNKILTLYEPEHFRKRRRYKEIPISLIHSKPYLHANLAVSEDSIADARLLIDTGASHALLIDSASHSNYTVPENSLERILGWTVSGPIKGNVARVEKVSLEPFEFDEVIASFPNAGIYLDYVKKTNRQGTIGGDLLSRFKVILDYRNEKVYLRKGHQYRNRFKYDMSGLTLTREKQHNYMLVRFVQQDSPAALAGLKVGDRIYYINGKPVEKYTFAQINELLRSRKRKRIRLQIKRGEESDKLMKYKFRLKKMI